MHGASTKIMSVCLYSCLSYPASRANLLSSATCPALSLRPKLYRERHDFRGGKKVTEHKMCFEFFIYFVRKHLILIRIQRDIIIHVHRFILLHPLVHCFNTLKLVKYLKHSYMFRHNNVIIRE